MKPTAIDLFSGCGGLTLGLKRAGFSVLCAIEIEPHAARTFALNHPEVRLESSDIRLVCTKRLKRNLKLRVGELDLLAGCPPCQGFSSLRTRNGAVRNRDQRNGLLGEMLRFAEALRPKSIMMENVPGLAKYRPFRSFCARLEELGYVVRVAVKDAAHYAVPQRRRRLILLAGRGFELPFAMPCRRGRSVRDAISHLPARLQKDPVHLLPERRSEKVLRLIRDIPRDGGSRRDLAHERQLDCHKRSDGFGDIYGRMAWNCVAPTITSGCFNPSKGRFLHPIEDRAITMREAALLQSFPARYRFDISGGKESVALMIGNALPPEFIRRHAVAIKRTLLHGEVSR